MQQSILYGNGLNLLNNEKVSWKDLLCKVASKDPSITRGIFSEGIPNTIKYDALIKKGSLYNNSLKDDIKQETINYQSNEAYVAIRKLPINHLITTNYDLALFAELPTENYPLLDLTLKTEENYNIRRHYHVNFGQHDISFWPIHGTIMAPRSIMLGYNHYCGSVAKISNYIKGKYQTQMNDGTSFKIAPLIERLKNKQNRQIYSWIDLFFMTDIHIIGLSLDFAEIDLWWILQQRKHLINQGIINNSVRYYFNLPPDINKLHELENLVIQNENEIQKLLNNNEPLFNNTKEKMARLLNEIKTCKTLISKEKALLEKLEIFRAFDVEPIYSDVTLDIASPISKKQWMNCYLNLIDKIRKNIDAE